VLNEKLSYLLLCEASCLEALNGASQVYPFLRRRFEGAKALIPVPTFGEYKAAFPRHETYADDGNFSIEEVERGAENADVVVFVTPNNPTGTVCDPAEILAFAGRNRGKTILVDESFLAFHTMELCGAGSMVRLLEREPIGNVHVICSLSKTLGMPGLRLGYVYSRNAELLRGLRAELPIWNLNSVAEFLMEVALKHRASIEDSLRATARDREAFRELLGSLDAVESVMPGSGNFLLVRFRWSAERGRAGAAALLTERAVYVKDISARFDDGRAWWRLAVRLPEENVQLCEAIGALG
jgi:histidinol-phosphate/aromatic aminotransferase/cobyric acid decarboxylase-like protein